MRLKDQVAIITGASRGIGKALALAFAKEGADVVVTGKTDQPDGRLPGTIHETAKEIQFLGRRALAVKLDVRHEEQIDDMVRRTYEKFGRIDILINNAGAISLTDVLSTPAKKFDLVLGVNARAAYLCSRAVLPRMIERKYGHIIMMSPPMVVDRAPGKTAYMFSKLGMTFIAQSLSEEMREHNIAVNALWPVTAIESQATKHFWPGQEETWRTPEIMCDATLAIVTRKPSEYTGRAVMDEDVLKEIGITDYSKYAVVPGTNPPPFSKFLVSK
ncbi:MAG: SDR family oxidoreductase [Nitrospirae bacterium]|nr:SDR family oxidoreductase [Nitrospirota bacterium]